MNNIQMRLKAKQNITPKLCCLCPCSIYVFVLLVSVLPNQSFCRDEAFVRNAERVFTPGSRIGLLVSPIYASVLVRVSNTEEPTRASMTHAVLPC